MVKLLLSNDQINPDITRKMNAIIKMASGAIKNIFDNDRITAMNF